MARKKKSEAEVIDEVSKLIAEETLQATDPEVVKVDKGSHLTVTYYSNGKTSLSWDWEALQKDVREAIASVSTNIVEVTEEKVKKTRSKKTKEKA